MEPVELLRHTIEALTAINQDCLRGLEALAGLQFPARVICGQDHW